MFPTMPGAGMMTAGNQINPPPDLASALSGLQDPMMAAMQSRDQGGGYAGGMSPLMAAILGLMTKGGTQPLDNGILQALLGGGGQGTMGGMGGPPMPGMGMPGMMGAAPPQPMY